MMRLMIQWLLLVLRYLTYSVYLYTYPSKDTIAYSVSDLSGTIFNWWIQGFWGEKYELFETIKKGISITRKIKITCSHYIGILSDSFNILI